MASACVANVAAALFVLTKLKFWSYIDIKNYKSSTTKNTIYKSFCINGCFSIVFNFEILFSLWRENILYNP